MPRRRRNDKAVLLNLPVEIFDRVDRAAEEQNVTRTQFLRQSVERNLRHYEGTERAIFERLGSDLDGWDEVDRQTVVLPKKFTGEPGGEIWNGYRKDLVTGTWFREDC